MNNELLSRLEEHAFYESGLSADGCFENLDQYARQAITKYGRILISEMQEAFDMQTKLVVDLEVRLMDSTKELEEHREELRNVKKICCDKSYELLDLVFKNRKLEQEVDKFMMPYDDE